MPPKTYSPSEEKSTLSTISQENKAPAPKKPRDSLPLHSRSTEHSSLPLRIPAARLLPHSRQLARALRPLMQRVPSRTTFQLDEIATVERIAETQMWLPVTQGVPERHFDLILLRNRAIRCSFGNR
ncbi:MAG: hypothetical protein R3E08_01505 [Thiotrichaceae bacterium]